MTRRRPLAIPAIIAAGIRRAEKERRANVIARPMRNLMDMLKQGDEFDATVQRLADIPPGQVTSAIRTTEIAWEIEKLQGGESA